MVRICLLTFLLSAILSGCGNSGKRPDRHDITPTADTVTHEISDISLQADICADSLLHLMDDGEKSAQLFMPAVYASSDPYTMAAIKEYADKGIGGIILLKGDARSAALIADSLRRWSRIPPFIAIDAEWGLAMRLAETPEFPLNSTISEDADESLMFDYGLEVARECRKLGINMILGPVLDISGKKSYMTRRSLGEDPERVATLSVAYARGLESGNVVSVAKHFPGHGAAKGDSHKRKTVIERSLMSLDSVDLYPFRKYIEQRLSAIMVGHMAFPAIDPEMLPAAVSPAVITDLLRTDMGFDGLILTDALNMSGAAGYGADKAITAGADMVLAPAHTDAEIKKIKNAIEEGTLSTDILDTHVKRILFRKFIQLIGHRNEMSPADSLPSSLSSDESRRIIDALR